MNYKSVENKKDNVPTFFFWSHSLHLKLLSNNQIKVLLLLIIRIILLSMVVVIADRSSLPAIAGLLIFPLKVISQLQLSRSWILQSDVYDLKVVCFELITCTPCSSPYILRTYLTIKAGCTFSFIACRYGSPQEICGERFCALFLPSFISELFKRLTCSVMLS
jgi:hypothetical protein